MNSAEQFWRKVDCRSSDECWNWTASLHKDGYGNVWWVGKCTLAHRVAWELTQGSLLEGECVLHRCDNPRCVNPDHLFLGNQKINMVDCSKKRRIQHGERSGRVKLTDEDISRVREASLFGAKRCDIASSFGISAGYVSHLVLTDRYNYRRSATQWPR